MAFRPCGLAGYGRGRGGICRGGAAPSTMSRSETRIVRDVGTREDIDDTGSLVNAYNEEVREEERATIGKWLSKYVELFSDGNFGDMTDAYLRSYAELANIVPKDKEAEKLLRRYFYSMCNLVSTVEFGEKTLIQSLDAALKCLHRKIFINHTPELFKLTDRLLKKLNRQRSTFTKRSHPTHSVTLFAIYQALAVLREIAPNELDTRHPQGPYHLFKKELEDIAADVRYYPLLFLVNLVQQSVHRLALDSVSASADVGRRMYYSLTGWFSVGRVVKSAAGADINIGAIEDAYKRFKEACRAGTIPDKPWFEWIDMLDRARSLATKEPEKYEIFEGICIQLDDILNQLKSKGEKREADRKAILYGVIQQLRILAIEAKEDVREKALDRLMAMSAAMCPVAQKREDPDMIEAMMDALYSVHVNNIRPLLTGGALSQMVGEVEKNAHPRVSDWLGNDSLKAKLAERPEPESFTDQDIMFDIARKRMGIKLTRAAMKQNIDDMKGWYTARAFVEVKPCIARRSTSLSNFKHWITLLPEVDLDSLSMDLGPLSEDKSMMEIDSQEKLPPKSIAQDTLAKLNFKDERHGKGHHCVLLHGAPGSGKTMFAKMLVHEWAGDRLESPFKAVYYLPVEKLGKDTLDDNCYRSERTLETAIACFCFPRKNETDFKALKSQILDDLDKHTTLLILDGLEKVDEHIFEMIHPASEHESAILALSRSKIPCQDMPCCHKIECCGFDDAQLHEFFHSCEQVSDERKEELVQHAKADSDLWEQAHFPFVANVLCELVRERQRGENYKEYSLDGIGEEAKREYEQIAQDEKDNWNRRGLSF